MAKVIITEQYLEDIADAIRAKNGSQDTYYPSEMADAIEAISGNPVLQSKTYNVSSAGTATVTADNGYDGLSSVNVSVPEGELYLIPQSEFYTESNTRKFRFRGTAYVNPFDDEGTPGYIEEGSYYGGWANINAIAKNTTVTPTESAQTIGGTNYMMEGAVTVNAIPSNYVGSGITQRSSSDLTASGATVTVPSGYYSAQVSKSVASGTAGTPTATKVVDTDDASALITPSVTNTTGYITGGTKTGTPFYVTARELVSGITVTCDEARNWDVAEVETLVVPSGTAGTPTATKGTVSNHSISVTPSVTNQTGYITGSTKTGTVVTVSASELVSGTLSVTSNGTKDVTNYASVNVNISSEAPSIESLSVTPSESEQTFNASTVDGYKPVTVGAISSTYVGSGITRRSSTDLTASGATVSVPAGYYSAAASKSVASGSATAPASISGTAASVSTGNGTLTLTKTVSVTPSVTAGYVSSGTAGNSSVSLTASVTIDPTPTASGATVTIPAGYYSAQTTKSVTTMTLPTSAAASATSGYTSKATISRSTSDQYINIAPGYNSAGGYYKISAVANGSATGPSSLSGSSATVSTGTNTLTLTKTGVTTTPTVTAGYVSSATASTATVTLTASVTTKAAATITPTTTNQTIAAGTYLTGAQTIVGDADLVGSNILSTANIFGVQGTVDFIDIYIRSAAPTSSVGSDGDIYIQE